MPAKWSTTIEFTTVILEVEDNFCKMCNSPLLIRTEKFCYVQRLSGAIKPVCKLSCCSNEECLHRKTLDSSVKVQTRRKVRGLRQIEKETLAELDGDNTHCLTEKQQKHAADIVLDYRAAVRGILNDSRGGPFNPSGLRMYHALDEILQSLQSNFKLGKTPISSKLSRLSNRIKRGLLIYEQDKAEIVKYTQIVEKVMDTLKPTNGKVSQRVKKFIKIKHRLQKSPKKDLIAKHMMKIMQSFGSGLFAESDDLEIPGDNLDLERWFKKPKGHERRIHRRKHTGIRLVYEGPTLLLALDAHSAREKPFSYLELLPYVDVEVPESQRKSVERNQIMKKASSKKKSHFIRIF